MRPRTILISLVLAASVPASVVFAAVNLKGTPTFTESSANAGFTLTASGNLSGLGTGPATVLLSASGTGTATCTNGGNNTVSAQTPPAINASGSEFIPGSTIHQGRADFSVTTKPISTTVPSSSPQFSCPNPNWTETITDVDYTSAVITVQEAGATVLTANCTFNATEESSQATGVSCTTS